jgi:phosphoglycolate phosphatase
LIVYCLPGASRVLFFMHPNTFDLIVFDWDGTLSDSTALIANCLRAAAVDVGAEEPSAASALYVIGMGLHQALAHMAPDVPMDRYSEMASRYRYHYAQQQNQISLFAGVLPMLHELKRKHHWLAVATGKSRQGLNEALAHSELRGLFDASRTADETQSKPHPLMLEELMDEFSVAPTRTLMIGDTVHDLEMAAHAGCASVGVSYGAHAPDAFPVWKPKTIVHSATELHNWLLAHA